MKHAYDDINDWNIRSNMENFKKHIRIFKKSGLNDKMLTEKLRKREVSASFGTNFDIVERFILSASNVVSVIDNAEQDAAKSANDAFYAIQCNNSSYQYFNELSRVSSPLLMPKQCWKDPELQLLCRF